MTTDRTDFDAIRREFERDKRRGERFTFAWIAKAFLLTVIGAVTLVTYVIIPWQKVPPDAWLGTMVLMAPFTLGAAAIASRFVIYGFTGERGRDTWLLLMGWSFYFLFGFPFTYMVLSS